MPIFLVRVTNQTTKEFAVNCNDQEDARRVVTQSVFNSASANPNVVRLNNQTSENTDVSQVEASANWEDYVNKGIK